ncbi:MAG: hypothetical protein WCT37_00585 [Patescibacteria group bacterium]
MNKRHCRNILKKTAGDCRGGFDDDLMFLIGEIAVFPALSVRPAPAPAFAGFRFIRLTGLWCLAV